MTTSPRWLTYPLAVLAVACAAETATGQERASADPTPRLVVFEMFTRFT
ncbi:MAG TPA: hypothetical protein VMT19_06525 [Thermoanaerobaculaceae bacterium]|nr:hypothetical protein [Thermoanaerobaculaceae bacterium]